jgi:hypothetical protein
VKTVRGGPAGEEASMAQVNLVAWNIEVFGPEKYGNRPNADRVIQMIATVLAQTNADIFVAMELSSSVAEQICYNIAEAADNATGYTWNYAVVEARPNGDRESYGVLFRVDNAANFALLTDGNGDNNIELSTVDFPNNFSDTNGRRACLATFRTTDTNTNFTVSVYHAPPNARAIQGLEALAKTPGLYSVDNGGNVQNVPGRLLGGDYNLDVNVQPEYSWLTNAVPANPPPTQAGEGAGCVAITTAKTHLGAMKEAIATWGTVLANWPANPLLYRDEQYDNIFYDSPSMAPNPGGGVFDMIAEIMNVHSAIRGIAQQFTTLNPTTNNPAFPFAFSIPTPLNVNLSLAPCAWMLYRYGVSDHYPIVLTITL